MLCSSFVRRPAAVALGALTVVLGMSVAPRASAEEFYLNDPLTLSAGSIKIDSRIRPLHGTVSGFTGAIRFDPAAPEKLQGDVKIPLESLHVGSFLVTEVLLSDQCLDAAKHPVVKFSIKGIDDVKEFAENSWSFTVNAAMGLRGRAGLVNFPATLVYIPDGMTERSDGSIDGDLIVLRGDVSFDPVGWGVSTDLELVGAIGDQVEIDFSAVGYTMRSARRSGSDQ